MANTKQPDAYLRDFEPGYKPAFPASGSKGLTVRQYYAAHAPITMKDAIEHLESSGVPYNPGSGVVRATLARMRFEYADAMVEAESPQ